MALVLSLVMYKFTVLILFALVFKHPSSLSTYCVVVPIEFIISVP